MDFRVGQLLLEPDDQGRLVDCRDYDARQDQHPHVYDHVDELSHVRRRNDVDQRRSQARHVPGNVPTAQILRCASRCLPKKVGTYQKP